MSEELWGAATLSTLFLIIVAIAEVLARTGRGTPEITRKFVHLGGGLVCLLFPYLVDSVWTVAAMACALALFFGVGERLNLLTCLNRVKRRSSGSQYYPFAILGVFYFSAGAPWLFIPSVLVLALADAGAALVGGRFGRVRYTVDYETKSLEGSLVFFLLAFCCLAAPTLYLAPLPSETVLWSATLVALLVTGVEAVSRGGRDNIFVPLAVCLILKRISSKPPIEIIYQNVSLLALIGALAFFAWRSRAFNVGGTLTAILFFYASWSLGSETWTLPVFLACVGFMLARRNAVDAELVRTGLAVSALTIPFLVLLAANGSDRYDFWFGPFVMTAVATLALAQLRCGASRLAVGLGAWGWIAIPSWAMQATSSLSLLFGMLAISIAITVPRTPTRSMRQLTVAAAISGVVLLQLAGAELWRPRTASLAMEPVEGMGSELIPL